MEKIEFSIPLMFVDNFANKILEINNKTEKTKITSVYGSFPINIQNKIAYEQRRLKKKSKINTEEDFFDCIKKIQEIGIDFVYLINSPKSLTGTNFYKESHNINTFIEKLLKNNIQTVEVTNTQILDYLTINYPQLNIKASTLQEYTSVKQYKNLFEAFPNIKELTPSWDMNRNFRFLKNLKNNFNKKVEIIVNDGCLSGCPFRVHHNMSLTYDCNEKIDLPTENKFGYVSLCKEIINKNPWEFVALQNVIYPWQIKTYAQKYGITKFRLVEINPNKSSEEKDNESISFFEAYIKGIEDYNAIKNLPLKLFNHYTSTHNIIDKNITIDKVKEYLPDIKYFEKYGDNCLNTCGNNCKYCYNIAGKLNEKFPLK